jgi:threonine/homoserine/homoserine lactone efflux protein
MNEYLLFFIGMALMVMVPGPDFMNVVGQSLRGNLRIGMMSAAGVGAGLCVHVSAAIPGLSAILLSSAFAYEAVRWVGAAYLIYLGVRALLFALEQRADQYFSPHFGQTEYRSSLSQRVSG